MKICIITPYPPKQHGIADYSKNLVDSLQNEEISIYVISHSIEISSKKNDGSMIKEHGENVHIIEAWNPHSLLNQLFIFNKIVQIQPDVIHVQYGSHSLYGGLLGEPLWVLILLLKLIGIPRIITLHSLWLPREAETRAYDRTNNRFIAKIASMYYYFFTITFLNLFNIVLVCVNFSNSKVTRKLIEKFGISPLIVHETVLGCKEVIDIHKRVNVKNRLDLGNHVFLFFGFIRKGKGYEYAIQAISYLKKDHSDIKLVIAGKPLTLEDMDYLIKIKRLVKNIKLDDRIIFDTRFIPTEDLTNYFLSSDALLLPYSLRVGPSAPLAMAASFGLPVIMTVEEKFSMVNVSNFIKLVPPNNSISLANAMQELVENEEKRNKMSRDAILYASKHSFARSAKEHLYFYFLVAKNMELS